MKIAAIDIGGTAIKYCQHDTDSSFSEIKVSEISTDALEGGSRLMQKIIDLLTTMEFDQIAICTAGQVDAQAGSIIYATDNIPNYTGTQIKTLLNNRFGKPVWVENDVNAAALGEGIYGAAQGCKDFLCLTYGTGIGGAVIIDQKVYQGSRFIAGEFGHIITHAEGNLCTCGQRGCYETYASTAALVRQINAKTGETLNGKKIFAQYQNNSEITSIVEQWINEIVYGLVSLVYIFNPSTIVLGGGIMRESIIINTLEEALKKHLMSSFTELQVLQAKLGNTAGLLGMIYTALQNSKT